MKNLLLAAAAALGFCGSAQATTVLFFDDFEADGPKNTLNYTGFANWTVEGQVDLVGMPNGFGITCDGNCVDLDGTAGPGAITSKPIAIAAGRTVRVEYDLSGSQRSTDFDSFTFQISFAPALNFGGGTGVAPPGIIYGFGPNIVGGFAVTTLVAGTMPFGSYFFEFMPLQATNMQLRFSTRSADRIGPLLDNVRVTQAAIPEPATWGLMIAGFGLVGWSARRRRHVVATA